MPLSTLLPLHLRSLFGPFPRPVPLPAVRPILAIEDESPSPHPAAPPTAPDGHQSALKYYTRRPKTKAAPSADLP